MSKQNKMNQLRTGLGGLKAKVQGGPPAPQNPAPQPPAQPQQPPVPPQQPPTPSTPSQPPAQPPKPNKKEAPPKSPAEQIKGFIDEYKLETMLPPDFANLTEAQQLKVTQDTKKRIVDLVKLNGQTQYSEDVKDKSKLRASVNKDLDTKNAEAKAFADIVGTDEGKQLIAENLAQLTEINKDREIVVNSEGKPEIVFFTPEANADDKEKSAIGAFNTAANKFREIPYEWGQEEKNAKWNPEIVKSNKTKYEKAKKEWEQARNAILEIEKGKKGEVAAVTDMLQVDNLIQMEQLINTHPEFEAELLSLSKDKSKFWGWKDVVNAGGKGRWNKILAAGGFTARLAAKGAVLASAATGVTYGIAAGVGAIVGGIRGRLKGKETLKEKQLKARHGEKDTVKKEYEKGKGFHEAKSAESAAVTDVTHLTDKLKELIDRIENPQKPEYAVREEKEYTRKDGTTFILKEEKYTEDEVRASALSKLQARIDHTRGKIEKGQVNFGDAKSALVNQFELINNLNKALVLEQVHYGKNDDALKMRIDGLLATQGKNIAERTSKARSTFVNKQMWKGVGIGLGAASVGYAVRFVYDYAHGLVATAENPNIGSHWQNPLAKVKTPDLPIKNLKITADTLRPGPETAAAVQPGAPGAGIAQGINAAPGSGHEIIHDFSVKLGENGVPKNLETVYNEISADHMSVPDGGKGMIDEEFATKSLNMAANLVKLTEHHNVAGINADDFAKVASFKDGVLQIKDHAGFNDIVSKLQTHSEELWAKGTLQGDGAAITQIPNITHDSWLKIMHADGLHQGTDLNSTAQIDTGILGHQEVDAAHITNFNDSEMVKHAMIHGQEEATASSKAEILHHIDTKIDAKDLAPGKTLAEQTTTTTPGQTSTETPQPVNKDIADKLEKLGYKGDPNDREALDAFAKGNRLQGGSAAEAPKVAQTEVNDPNFKNLTNLDLSPQKLAEASAVNEKTIQYISHGEFSVWDNLNRHGASEFMSKHRDLLSSGDFSSPNGRMARCLTLLKQSTGDSPWGRSLLHIRPETTKHFITRCLQKLAATNEREFERFKTLLG